MYDDYDERQNQSYDFSPTLLVAVADSLLLGILGEVKSDEVKNTSHFFTRRDVNHSNELIE